MITRTTLYGIFLMVLFLVLGMFSGSTFIKVTHATEDMSSSLNIKKKQISKKLDELDSRISRLEKADTTDSSQKSELDWLYQAREFSRKSLSSIELIQTYFEASQDVPSRLRSIEQELATPLPPAPKVDETEPLSSLEQKLETARAGLGVARKVRNDIEIEAVQRSERLQKISDEIANARKRQEELTQLITPLASNGGKETTAKQSAIDAEFNYINLFLLELEQEQLSYDARRELLRARRQHAERQVLIMEQRFNALEQHVNQRRTVAAAVAMQAAENSSLAATSVHPVVRTVMNENQKLAAELTRISAQSSILSVDKKRLEEILSNLRRQYDGVKEKIAQIGLTDAIGLKLRGDRNQLPDLLSYSSSLKKHRIDVDRVQLRRIEIEDRLLDLVDINREAQRLLENSDDISTESEQKTVSDTLKYVLNEQREKYLSELIKAYDIHFEKHLYPIMEAESELIKLITEYREFIDTRILWIQSSPSLELADIDRLGSAIPWLLSPTSISQVSSNLAKDFLDNPFSIGSSLLAIALLMRFYNRLREKLSELGRYVTKLSKAKFTDTLLAAVVTALMVMPSPMLIYLIAWRIGVTGTGDSYSLAVSSGLYTVAHLLFLGLLLRRICRPDGLGESHFRWKSDNLNIVRRQLSWFLPIVLPLAFVVATTLDQPVQAHHDSLGRVAFIALMLATSLYIYKVFKPSSGILKDLLAKHPGGWLSRLSRIWFPLLVGTPTMLAIASIMGYFYTAVQLCLYITGSIGLVLIANIIREFFIRWLSITQRKLALEQWRKKIESQTEIEKSDKSEAVEVIPTEEPGVDVDAISAQTIRLINSVYWLTIFIGGAIIWSEVLPAFNLLNDIELWSSGSVDGESGSTLTPTTLANIILAVVILLMTLFISRNIPGLLEIAVLQHLPFTPGGRYAITTITRYVLVIVGLAMTFNAIGIGWSKVQWLAAAVTVGLGFGLQEIFANFVSGLIILFERQIRVGDAVTVGNISGKVSRIQMRATTITDWDRKELIIPNKEFVTGQVINWSLSDTILRMIIPVGIAYGSDTKLAYDVLLNVAHENSNVLDNPEPNVRFVAFGESTLDFELRVFIPHPDLLLETQHDLNMEIDRRFRDENIEIAFPQRDIHIRHAPEILTKFSQEQD